MFHDDISLYIDESESTLPLSKEESKQQDCGGLPPTGKRIDSEHTHGTKSSTRVRMRSRPTRTYQLQASPVVPSAHSISLTRPMSFNERLSPVIQRRESSPSIDRSDFLTDTSSISSRICSPTTRRPLLGSYHPSSPLSSPAFITCPNPSLTSQTTAIDTSSDVRCHPMTNDQIDSS